MPEDGVNASVIEGSEINDVDGLWDRKFDRKRYYDGDRE